MRFLIGTLKSLTKFERSLWGVSVFAIAFSFVALNNTDYLTLCASLVGATALIFVAKGNVIGQFLIVLFGVIYGIISFNFKYYGEMLTYLGMSTPVAIAAIVSWLKNPFQGNKADVEINTLQVTEYVFMFILSCGVTTAFYFILRALGTANLVVSTISVFTSFVPCYLLVRRSEFYAVGYAVNDIILIILWTMASFKSLNYLSMVICFIIFLINDIYGFIQWSKNKKRQRTQSLSYAKQ